MQRNARSPRKIANSGSLKKPSYRKKAKMDQKVFTKEISNEELGAALEMLYRSMGLIKPYEDLINTAFTEGPILVTFTVQVSEDGGVRNISYKT
jgi:hypothetical protein